MKDRWMNIGFEEDELTPYSEPNQDLNDHIRIRKSVYQDLNDHIGIRKSVYQDLNDHIGIHKSVYQSDLSVIMLREGRLDWFIT